MNEFNSLKLEIIFMLDKRSENQSATLLLYNEGKVISVKDLPFRVSPCPKEIDDYITKMRLNYADSVEVWSRYMQGEDYFVHKKVEPSAQFTDESIFDWDEEDLPF